MKNLKFKLNKKVILVALCSVALAGCLNENGSPTSASDTASASGNGAQTYVVYSEQSYVPFLMHSGGAKNEITGFEYEILEAIAEVQGINFDYKIHSWHDLFKSLERGEADIIASGITITEDRLKTIDFSDSFVETETALLTKDKNVKDFSDLKDKKIAYQEETLQLDVAHKHGVKGDNLVGHRTPYLAIKSVINNQTSASLGDKIVFNYYKHQNKQQDKLFVVSIPNQEKEQLGFGVRKGNYILRNQLNEGLSKIKSNGTYQKIYNKWFGHLE